MRKIYFRADAGTTIGYGHFIRTLALADMLKEDFDCTFFTCHPTSYQIGEMETVCPFVTLQEETHYDDFLSYLQGDEIVVLDNYFFGTDYQRAIKQKGCRLVCIDDMHDKHYVADVVINHGLTNTELFDIEPYTRLCLGLEWALLRKPFLEAIEHPSLKKSELLVFGFGGSDPLKLTDIVSNVLESHNGAVEPIAVIGDGVKRRMDFTKYHRVKFVDNLSANQMASLFADAKYALLPASGMCLEAIACGCRLIVGYFVDNQKRFSNYLAQEGYSYNLGNMTDDSFQERLCALLESTSFSFVPKPMNLKAGIEERYVQLFHTI